MRERSQGLYDQHNDFLESIVSHYLDVTNHLPDTKKFASDVYII